SSSASFPSTAATPKLRSLVARSCSPPSSTRTSASQNHCAVVTRSPTLTPKPARKSNPIRPLFETTRPEPDRPQVDTPPLLPPSARPKVGRRGGPLPLGETRGRSIWGSTPSRGDPRSIDLGVHPLLLRPQVGQKRRNF